MAELGIKDTISYKIVDQMVSHVHPHEEFSESDFLRIYHTFMNSGGKWEEIISGDPSAFEELSKLISAFFKIRKNPKKYGLK